MTEQGLDLSKIKPVPAETNLKPARTTEEVRTDFQEATGLLYNAFTERKLFVVSLSPDDVEGQSRLHQWEALQAAEQQRKKVIGAEFDSKTLQYAYDTGRKDRAGKPIMASGQLEITDTIRCLEALGKSDRADEATKQQVKELLQKIKSHTEVTVGEKINGQGGIVMSYQVWEDKFKNNDKNVVGKPREVIGLFGKPANEQEQQQAQAAETAPSSTAQPAEAAEPAVEQPSQPVAAEQPASPAETVEVPLTLDQLEAALVHVVALKDEAEALISQLKDNKLSLTEAKQKVDDLLRSEILAIYNEKEQAILAPKLVKENTEQLKARVKGIAQARQEEQSRELRERASFIRGACPIPLPKGPFGAGDLAATYALKSLLGDDLSSEGWQKAMKWAKRFKTGKEEAGSFLGLVLFIEQQLEAETIQAVGASRQ